MTRTMRKGPLSGVRVVELGGVGPVPFCGMYFADMGAEVIRIERPLGTDPLSLSRQKLNLLARGKRTIAMDFRGGEGLAVARDLVAGADIVMEGFRSGVLERIGLGPDAALGLNPRLVYGRMSGWGSGGPMSRAAAHDINFIGLSGLLNAIGPRDLPMPPLNLVGDFGGSLYLVTGLLAALTHARASGEGQVVEASIMGGAIALMSQLYTIHDNGDWSIERESNWFDGGAPYYRCYKCSDGGFMAVGAIEPQFYKELVAMLGLSDLIDLERQMDRSAWADTTARFAGVFSTRSRDEWARLAAEVEACCTPVLDLDEAREHPQALASGMFAQVGERIEPAPQPLFSGTPPDPLVAATPQGTEAASILAELGRTPEQIEALFAAGIVSRPAS